MQFRVIMGIHIDLEGEGSNFRLWQIIVLGQHMFAVVSTTHVTWLSSHLPQKLDKKTEILFNVRTFLSLLTMWVRNVIIQSSLVNIVLYLIKLLNHAANKQIKISLLDSQHLTWHILYDIMWSFINNTIRQRQRITSFDHSTGWKTLNSGESWTTENQHDVWLNLTY